jgi:hypothetical protein
MPSGYPKPVTLKKDGVETPFPSIRSAWLTALRDPNDRPDKIRHPNRKKVYVAISAHTQINGYYIFADK